MKLSIDISGEIIPVSLLDCPRSIFKASSLSVFLSEVSDILELESDLLGLLYPFLCEREQLLLRLVDLLYCGQKSIIYKCLMVVKRKCFTHLSLLEDSRLLDC